MLLEYELPRHVSDDWVYPHTSSVRGEVRERERQRHDG